MTYMMSWKTGLRGTKAVKAAIAVFLFADTALIFAIWTPARLYALLLVGRGGGCSTTATLESTDHSRRILELKHYFTTHSRVVESDPSGLDIWETPEGRFWVPRGDLVLPLLLAEQHMKIYGSGETLESSVA